MSVAIGALRHRLTIEQPVRTDDGGGGASVSWETLAEVWGAVEAVSGKETVAADRVSGQISYRIIVRYRSDLVPAMRFRRDGEIFEIRALRDKDGRKRFLHCDCERRDL